jgi:hypothetical protein
LAAWNCLIETVSDAPGDWGIACLCGKEIARLHFVLSLGAKSYRPPVTRLTRFQSLDCLGLNEWIRFRLKSPHLCFPIEFSPIGRTNTGVGALRSRRPNGSFQKWRAHVKNNLP